APGETSRGDSMKTRHRIVSTMVLPVVSSVFVWSGGCSNLSTSVHNDDRVLRSTETKARTEQTAFRAQMESPAYSSVAVRAVRQTLCETAVHQVVDRTIVTTRSARSTDLSMDLLLLGLGGLSLVVGTGGTIEEVAGPRQPGPIALGVVLTAFGGWIV